MDLAQLAVHVGMTRFRRCCELAWSTAVATGRDTEVAAWPADLVDVPHELGELIEDDSELGFALYRAMPCYAVLMYLGFGRHNDAFWSQLAGLLDEPDDRLATPVGYWLWCGPFEDSAEAPEVWNRLIFTAGDLRVGRLLEWSGPVSWGLKAPLIERFVTERPSIALRALEGAVNDVLGNVDRAQARQLLDRLPTGPSIAELRTRLRRPTTHPAGRRRRRR